LADQLNLLFFELWFNHLFALRIRLLRFGKNFAKSQQSNVESTAEVCHSNFSNSNITLHFIPQLASVAPFIKYHMAGNFHGVQISFCAISS